MKAVETNKTLATLLELWNGKHCPHEKECTCRTSQWCPEANKKRIGEGLGYSMLHLAGCSLGYDHCCCRILDEIETLAGKYLKLANINEPPVPLEVLNLFDPGRHTELRRLPLKAHFGCTWFFDQEWVIYLNANDTQAVNRFTAFHEGFHVICRNTGVAFSQVDKGYRPLSERLADYFAASILMPRVFVHQLWPEVRSVSRIASRFDIPETAVRDWLIRLGILSRARS